MISFQHAPAAPHPLPAISAEADIVARMAQSLIELADGGVDHDALIRAGFTRAEIATHVAAAIDLANISGRVG